MQPEKRAWFTGLGAGGALVAAMMLAGCGGAGGGPPGQPPQPSPPPPVAAVLVSANNQGQAANAPVYATGMSPDARYVAFTSAASNLPGALSTGVPEVYLRDTCYSVYSGEMPPCTPETTMISVTPGGAPGNGPTESGAALLFGASNAAVSLGGRYVVFASMATDLTAVANPNPPAAAIQTFFRDTCRGAPAGCQPVTTELSTDANGEDLLAAGAVAMSAAGRYVADIEADGAGMDVILHDTCAGVAAGCAPSARAITTGGAVTAIGGGVGLSSDGSVVVYESTVSGSPAVYAATTCAGAVAGCAPVITALSAGIQAPTIAGFAFPFMYPAISGDGQSAGFVGTGAAVPGAAEAYRAATCAGPGTGCEPSPMLVSLGPNDAAIAGASAVALGGSGRYVAFVGASGPATPVPAGNTAQIYVRDTCRGVASGCTPQTRLISVGPQGQPASRSSASPLISQDGSEVVFTTSAPELGAAGVNDEVVSMPTGFLYAQPAAVNP